MQRRGDSSGGNSKRFADGLAYGTYCLKRLALSTGKAAWILGTSFLVVVLPLMVEMDRDQQSLELENQQIGVLTGNS